MYRDKYCLNVKFHCVSTVLIYFSLAAPALPSSAEISKGCAAAVPLDLNTTYRGRGYDESKTRYFALEIPDPGVVSLDISVPGGSEVFPKLGLLANECGGMGIAKRGLAVVERSAARLILAAEAPGIYYFRAGAQDPRRSLRDYKMTASFHEAPSSLLAMLSTATKEEEPVVVDPDPDLEASTDEPVVVDPDPDSKASAEEPVVVDPDSLHVGSAIRRLLTGLCSAARIDDHGDTPACATPVTMGRSATGRLANGWGDDYDLFSFTLTELETVFVGTSGTTDTFGALFDSAGQLLATDDDGGDGRNFLIVRTLSPGRYFVRVEGALSEEGPYELGLGPVAW